jgi:uncharacterized protein (TIGR03083 family)
MTDAWITATRASHDRLAALLRSLDEGQEESQSYDTEWTIADVASHLGSQSEIFGLFLDAAFAGEALPGSDVFVPIWDRWNALPPAEQVSESIAANEAFVTRIENLSDEDKAAFPIVLFGGDVDLAGLLAMRLGEHAIHAWDVAVALDPSATLAPDAVELLVDTVPRTAARSGKPTELAPIRVATLEPERNYTITLTPEVSVDPDADGTEALVLPAESFIRLIFGRLDPEHTPEGVDDDRLDALRTAFPGF